MVNFKKMKPSKKILSMAVAVAILACSAVPVLAAENSLTEIPSNISYEQNTNVSAFSTQVTENDNGAMFNAGTTDIDQPSPYASGDLSAGKSSSGTVTAKTVSSGSGSVTYTVNASGNYSIYIGNPSTANVKFDVSYIVN